MARVDPATMETRRQAILFALYAMDGNFTVNQVAEKAGGAYLRKQTSAVIRQRVADGSVLAISTHVTPKLYRLAPDDV